MHDERRASSGVVRRTAEAAILGAMAPTTEDRMSRERVETQSGATEAARDGERGTPGKGSGSAVGGAPGRVGRAMRHAARAAGCAAALGLAVAAGCSDTTSAGGHGGGSA